MDSETLHDRLDATTAYSDTGHTELDIYLMADIFDEALRQMDRIGVVVQTDDGIIRLMRWYRFEAEKIIASKLDHNREVEHDLRHAIPANIYKGREVGSDDREWYELKVRNWANMNAIGAFSMDGDHIWFEHAEDRDRFCDAISKGW